MDVIDPDTNFVDQILPHDLCQYFTLSEFCTLDLKKDDFSILNYNIRSFNKNGVTFQCMLESLHVKFKFLILTETWNNENNVDLCKIPGYTSFHTYRPKGHIYSTSGGISVLCEDSLSTNKNELLSICDQDIETCVVESSYCGEKYIIVAIYRPPQGSKLEFISKLESLLANLNTASNTVSIVGDFNLNLSDINDAHVTEFTSKLYSKFFLSLINKPTRFPHSNILSNPTTLDMIWTTCLGVSSSGILDFDITDHLPTFCFFDKPEISNDTGKVKITTRPYYEPNFHQLCAELDKIDWDSLLDYNDVNSCTITFIDKIDSLYRKCFPLKTKFVSAKRMKNKWITPNLKKLINKKSDSFRKFRRGLISKESNNKIKNEINAQIIKGKNNYYTNAFHRFRKNMRKSWDLLGELTGKDKRKCDFISLLGETGELMEINDVVNKFADHFGSIGRDLDSNLVQNDFSPYEKISRNPHTFNLFPASPSEIATIVSKLKLTSTDCDHMPVKIFKSIQPRISIPLTNLINASFSQSIFPQVLKLAKITPIYKKGNKKCCENYRPISSLLYLSKIFERCMVNRIISFFHKYSLFSKKQFGFLKGRSTQDAVLNFLESVYDALNSKKHNISILIDLKAAFDTVNHSILLNKLELYGIRGHCNSWLKSYLADREYQVRLQKTNSTRRTVNIGIPQGSILGPILFIIYNNDLPLISDKFNTTLFADDTNFSLTHSDYHDMIPLLNNELEKIYDWTIANRLTINTTKTEALLFTNRHVSIDDQPLLLGGLPVNYVDNARFLGVTIDKQVSFKLHINDVVGKVSKHAGILYKIKNNLPLSARLAYYNSFVLPYLTYNILHWGGTNETHLKPLVIIQKRIIRTIADADYLAHTSPLFYKLKLLKLYDLYRFQVVVDTRSKIDKGYYRTLHDRSTRNNQLACPKFHRLVRTQQSVTFNGPTFWNYLPENIRKIKSLTIFKKKLKNYYLNQYDGF